MDIPRIIELPKFLDERGNLSFLENDKQLPFVIKRVHWIYDVPGGEERGGVAYKTTEEFIVAMSGSFDVVVSDGEREWKFTLNRSYKGVYIPAGLWRSIENYSSNSVAVIAASTFYDPSDAVRDINELITNDASAMPNEPLRSMSRDKSLNEEKKYNVEDCGIIELDRHHSQRKGDISVVENGKEVPFDVKRIYYLYDVPGGADRGGHAHKALYQLIVAASGAFTVVLDDGTNKKAYTLNRPYQGLLVKPGIWRTLTDFSGGSICMVLASELYSPDDYIREYEKFMKYRVE
ncbi:MAG: WxcM-like domain-containing protein [Paludibacteraceae bacterium]|nr:WxcM-like domain-containing protein [Paludibacteraceae bacterium]